MSNQGKLAGKVVGAGRFELVTRRGRLAGIFFPRPEVTLPLELKRELYAALSADVKRQLKRRGVSEKEVLSDFEAWRKKRRAPASR